MKLRFHEILSDTEGFLQVKAKSKMWLNIIR